MIAAGIDFFSKTWSGAGVIFEHILNSL